MVTPDGAARQPHAAAPGENRLLLVSGAHGFIGSHVVERALAEGWRVRALVSPWGELDNLAPALAAHGDHGQGGEGGARGRLEVLRGDLTGSLRNCCRGVDAVIHAAARVREYGPWRPFFETNVAGTEGLLREAERAGVRRFVLVSSVAVFAYRGFRHADARALPRDRHALPYARSKIMAEDLTMASDLEPVVARPGLWPHGPRDPNFAKVARALEGGYLPLVGSGEAVVNAAAVENLAAGLLLCAAQPAAAGRAYLLAEPEALSWNELFGALAAELGVRPPWLRLPPAPTRALAALAEPLWQRLAPDAEPPVNRYRAALTVNDVHFHTRHAERELGFRPLLTWREGLARSAAAYRRVARAAGEAPRRPRSPPPGTAGAATGEQR